MIKGIDAWKKGNIVKLYIEMGEKSAKNEIKVKDYAQKRMNEKKSYLTEEEFHAIMDLNRDLRSYNV